MDDDTEWAWAKRAVFVETVGGDRKEITETQKRALIRSEKEKQKGSYEFRLYVDGLDNGELYTTCDINNLVALGERPTRKLYMKTDADPEFIGMLVFYTPEQWQQNMPDIDEAIDMPDPLAEPTPGNQIPECPGPLSLEALADFGRTTFLNLRDRVIDFPNYLGG